MKLKKLYIALNPSYADNPGKYTGEIEYEAEHGETKLVLDAEISGKILNFIGPVITAAATKVSKQLEADLQQSVTEANRPQILELQSEEHEPA